MSVDMVVMFCREDAHGEATPRNLTVSAKGMLHVNVGIEEGGLLKLSSSEARALAAALVSDADALDRSTGPDFDELTNRVIAAIQRGAV